MASLTCARCGQVAEGLPRPPLSGKLGQDIHAHVCADCWREWTQESVNIINHTGLQPVDPADRQKLYVHLREFLKLPAEIGQ
jgi:Fe-S cluster biosynthesis and repair protein YggX